MNESVTQIKDITGNPAPLGLLGFGMTTVLLNLHNAGFYELNSMILAMGICYGGAAQIIAGIMEWRKGNTFATTAPASNISPVTKESSAVSLRSTPDSLRCSTKFSVKSFSRSAL
jgi:hypothetical protein